MRRKIVAGNWKMNLNKDNRDELIKNLADSDLTGLDCELIVCPPAVYIENVTNELNGINVGAQNVSQYDDGAFTGEISCGMVKSLGVKYALVGHSERRAMFGDSDEITSLKVNRVMAEGLSPILCCGETLQEREEGKEQEVVANQVKSALESISKEDLSRLVLAYEPVWAIGTGKTASAEQAQEMHGYIRSLMSETFGQEGVEVPILYGGSCKPENAKELFACEDIDGGLIGGASLKASSFIAIAKSF